MVTPDETDSEFYRTKRGWWFRGKEYEVRANPVTGEVILPGEVLRSLGKEALEKFSTRERDGNTG